MGFCSPRLMKVGLHDIFLALWGWVAQEKKKIIMVVCHRVHK